MVNDPISNIGEGTHPKIARTDRWGGGEGGGGRAGFFKQDKTGI